MAVDIPELDGPTDRGLLRSSLFPLILTEASTFAAVLLLASSHFSCVSNAGLGPVKLLQLKQEALETH
jgi:hypothetical protein